MNETKYYVIYYSCGCGESCDFVEAKNEEDATSMAYQAAIDDYESFEGLHGIRGMADIAEEDFGVEIGDVDYDSSLYADIETAYFEEKEDAVDYWAEEITYEQYIRQDETWQEGDDDDDDDEPATTVGNGKLYLIDEGTLRELLRDSHKLAILERDGVDNWQWYMEGYEEYIAECAAMLPWNEGKSAKDIKEQFENQDDDYSIDNLVDDQIEAFWEEA